MEEQKNFYRVRVNPMIRSDDTIIWAYDEVLDIKEITSRDSHYEIITNSKKKFYFPINKTIINQMQYGI